MPKAESPIYWRQRISVANQFGESQCYDSAETTSPLGASPDQLGRALGLQKLYVVVPVVDHRIGYKLFNEK